MIGLIESLKLSKNDFYIYAAKKINIDTEPMDQTELEKCMPSAIKSLMDRCEQAYNDLNEFCLEHACESATDTYPHEEYKRLREAKDNAFEKLEENIKSKKF